MRCLLHARYRRLERDGWLRPVDSVHHAGRGARYIRLYITARIFRAPRPVFQPSLVPLSLTEQDGQQRYSFVALGVCRDCRSSVRA